MNIPHYQKVYMACSDLSSLDVLAFFNVCLCLTVSVTVRVYVSVLLCVCVPVSCLSVWLPTSVSARVSVYVYESVCSNICSLNWSGKTSNVAAISQKINSFKLYTANRLLWEIYLILVWFKIIVRLNMNIKGNFERTNLLQTFKL